MIVKRLTAIPSALAGIAAIFLLGSGAAAAQASTSAVHPIASIRHAAEAGMRGVLDPGLEGVELKAMALDPRLRLPHCQERLGAFATVPRHNQARVPVRVTCGAPSWTVHVPVDIRRTHPVLVLKRAVGRGERISAADVTTQTRVLPGLTSPFVDSVDQLEGRLTRRPLPDGSALAADALGAALLIHRGQMVTLVAETAGFQIRAPGKALADAAAGQRVRVQNLTSLKIIEGLADSRGVVRVLP